MHWGEVAAGPDIPFYTRLWVPGYGAAVVEDRGGAVTDNVIDVYMPSCAEAIQWGRQTLRVELDQAIKEMEEDQ